MINKKNSFLFVMVAVMGLLLMGSGIGPANATEETEPAPRVYKALIAQTTGDPYLLHEFVNTLGTDVSFVREQAGVFDLVVADPTFAITNTFVMVTGYNDGIATPETFEASPEDPYTVQFVHYQERTSLANTAKLMLVDGYNGSTAFYVWIEVYP